MNRFPVYRLPTAAVPFAAEITGIAGAGALSLVLIMLGYFPAALRRGFAVKRFQTWLMSSTVLSGDGEGENLREGRGRTKDVHSEFTSVDDIYFTRTKVGGNSR